MMYQVNTLPRSEADFDGYYGYIEQRSPAGAAAWANAFFRALKSLEQNPLAHGLAPEDSDHDVEIRQIFFRTRHGHNYRALYTIDGNVVYVLHIRGPGQDLMRADEVTLP
ncbi:MAG TPA: type II toxin-antitoxin system RelE/ParE family toxin [Pirellulaceae bacterium]|nr:type II toxin-antitoxin system RelE/ParE family toxin [Pirellulaceae bacterium]